MYGSRELLASKRQVHTLWKEFTLYDDQSKSIQESFFYGYFNQTFKFQKAVTHCYKPIVGNCTANFIYHKPIVEIVTITSSESLNLT